MAGWRKTIRFLALSGGIVGILANSAAALAKPAPPLSENPCPELPKQSACLDPIKPFPEDADSHFEVRNVRITSRFNTDGSRVPQFFACVVTNDTSVKKVTARAVLLDRQGNALGPIYGKPGCKPSPTRDMPSGAPKVLIDAQGEGLRLSEAELGSRSAFVIIVVDWTDRRNALHQDSFYLPDPGAPGAS